MGIAVAVSAGTEGFGSAKLTNLASDPRVLADPVAQGRPPRPGTRRRRRSPWRGEGWSERRYSWPPDLAKQLVWETPGSGRWP